jgi:hypothetical protein
MEYQLVLQFKVTEQEQFEWFRSIQDDLELMLGARHLVDGFDVGQGKMNIFIHTKYPKEAFELSKEAFFESDLNNMVAAYREVSNDKFILIWPKGSKKKFDLF